jgi:tRNA(Ile)-lysidine synthase
MRISLTSGKYVAAVSGGVDSAVLLDLLASQGNNYSLVVAHYDHGIRPDSKKDRQFVEKLAEKYGLEFYFAEGSLGHEASEALAREKRYQFLRKVKKDTASNAIITAHHRDDLIETAAINIIRGTGRKGLESLKSTPQIKRPLLDLTKDELLDYAARHKLRWHEDATNKDEKYLRNYVRHSVVSQLSEEQKKKLLQSIQSSKTLGSQIDSLLESLSREVFGKDKINKAKFRALPHEVSKELLASWLRKKGIAFDNRSLQRLAVFVKTAKNGAKTNIVKDYTLKVHRDFISLGRHQSV